MTTRCSLALLPFLALAACAGDDPADPGTPDAADPPGRAGLDRCGDGAALTPLWDVDNLHGAIVAMEVAADGTAVVATADGAVKQWALGVSGDAAPLPGGRPGYGEPLTGAGAAVGALAIDGGRVLGGDATGALRQWALPGADDLGARVLGDEPVTAVAPWSADEAVVADARFGGGIRIVPLDGAAAGAPVATALWGVTTLVRAGDAVYVAGHDYGMLAVERRALDDLATVTGAWDTLEVEGWVRDVAVSPDGARVALAGDADLIVLDAADLAAGPVGQAGSAPARSIAYTATGDHVAVATDDGRVALWDAALAAEVAAVDVPSPVALAVDPSGDRLVVASADGRLRAYACR